MHGAVEIRRYGAFVESVVNSGHEFTEQYFPGYLRGVGLSPGPIEREDDG